jgi:UPF0716 protein FxsA
MPPLPLLLLLAFPVVELLLLIKLAATVGFLTTVGWILATAVLGFVILRRQGTAVIADARRAVFTNASPVDAAGKGLAGVVAGVLLITPGVIADAIGLALLVPPLRRLIGRAVFGRVRIVHPTAGPGRAADGPGAGAAAASPRSAHKPRRGAGPVIETDYRRLDD